MAKKLKTITMGYEDNPIVSYVEGHVSAAEFNKAFAEEGWVGDPIHDDDIKHEHWVLTKKRWKVSSKNAKGAVAVTASYW